MVSCVDPGVKKKERKEEKKRKVRKNNKKQENGMITAGKTNKQTIFGPIINL